MLVGIAVAQVYIPTGVSTQSGIVRNVPTQIVRIPADTYINDGRQTYIAAQVPLQLFNANNRGNNNNVYTANTHNNRQFQTLNVREENLRRLIESETRLRDLLLLADQDNDNNNNNNNNYNTNYHNQNQNVHNNKNNNNNRFTSTDTFGTIQDQTNDNTNDNTNFNRNTHLTRDQLRTLVSTTNRDTSDLTQQYRTNTDTTGLQQRLRDTTLLGRL